MPFFQRIRNSVHSKTPAPVPGWTSSLASQPNPAAEPPQAAEPAMGPANSMDIQLQNRTESDTVYAYITGLAFERQNSPCLIKADGKTPYFPSSPAEILQPLQENCSIKLGAPGSITTVTIPQLAGGRIWFSVENELTFLLNPGPALVEPSISNPTDPNIDLEWDFCEFTFVNGSLYANISYVDFLSMSISMTLIPADGATQEVLGLKPDGFQSVVEGLRSQNRVDGSDWHKLVYMANGKPLRVLSPNNAIVMNGGNLFQTYYDPYIDQVYEKYTSTPLQIDTHAQWGTVSATVSNDSIIFPGIGSFAKPTTANIFSCSSGPFANNEGALGPLTARITAAFNRSTLLNEQVHPNEEKVDDFYKAEITNHYARLVHQANIDCRGYAFPYDDVPAGGGGVDQSGFVNGSPKEFLVSIG